MYDWTVLNQTVSETLANGRVGAPVFVRWTAAAAKGSDELKPLLAEMGAYAESWLAAIPRRVYATGAEAHGHLSLALEYDNGGSALLAITLAHDRPFMNLVILGARGAIYHSDTEIRPGLESSVEGGDGGVRLSTVLSPSVTLATIDRSLSVNQPVALSPCGDQL
jgi:hypothetical protein